MRRSQVGAEPGRRYDRRRPILIVGLLNSGLPFLLFSFAVLHIPTGISAILNATVPLTGALVAWLWLKDRPSGSRVLGLAIDGPTPVREFLAKRPVRFPVGLAGLNGAELARTLGNLRGGLPFTVLANPAGELIWRHPGETKYAQLAALRAKLLAG